MFIQSKAAQSNAHKDGLCIAQRRGGRETLVQWSNGDQQWCPTSDLVGRVVLLGDSSYNGQKENQSKSKLDKNKKTIVTLSLPCPTITEK